MRWTTTVRALVAAGVLSMLSFGGATTATASVSLQVDVGVFYNDPCAPRPLDRDLRLRVGLRACQVGFMASHTVGHWVWTDDYGWLWVSDEPYGWATHHYGRRYEDPIYGWAWVPAMTGRLPGCVRPAAATWAGAATPRACSGRAASASAWAPCSSTPTSSRATTASCPSGASWTARSGQTSCPLRRTSRSSTRPRTSRTTRW
jgi:hypothetical protein